MATFRSSLAVAFVFLSLAYAGAAEAPAPATVPADRAPEVMAQQEIEHVSPRRDSVGAQPKEFAWTAVRGGRQVAYSGRSAFVVLK